MQMIWQNPATILRAQIISLSLQGFLRWDEKGQALLVSDAPKHMEHATLHTILQESGLYFSYHKDLLRFDLHNVAYEAIVAETFYQAGSCIEHPFIIGSFVNEFVEMQAILSLLLSRDPDMHTACTANIVALSSASNAINKPLLRAAMLACAQGEQRVYTFIRGLPAQDAVALRQGNTLSVRTCAAICARYLYAEKGVGLPKQSAVYLK